MPNNKKELTPIEKAIKKLTTKEKEEILINLLSDYLSPAFGALPKNEIELMMLNTFVKTGYIDEEPEVYTLVSKLKITRSKARNLIYERELRRSTSSELDNKVIEILKNPVLLKDKDTFILEVENPLVLDHLKAKVKKIGHLSDGSFSPSVVRLSIDATVSLIEEYLSADIKEKAQKRLIKAGAPDNSLSGMLKASMKALAYKALNKSGEILVDELSDYAEPIVKGSFDKLKKIVKEVYPKKDD